MKFIASLGKNLSEAVLHAWRTATAGTFLFAAVIMLDVILVVSAFVSIHYFGADAISSLTFIPNDGWCDLTQMGIGNHCFGDYAIMPQVVLATNPWDINIGIPWNYPAAAMIVPLIFVSIGNFFQSSQVGLFLFLGAAVAAIVAPGVWAGKGKSPVFRLLVWSLFGVLAVPAVMGLDRANSVIFVVPVILWFLVSIARGNFAQAAIAVTLAGMVKPQFALLFVIFLILRKWRWALISFAGILLANVGAFLLWPKTFPMSIVQSISNTLQYGTGVSLSSMYPTNVSLAQGFYVGEYAVRSALGLNVHESWVDGHQNLVSLLFVAVILGVLFLAYKKIPPVLVAIFVVVMAFLVAPTSWSYYLLFALPVAAVILREPAHGTSGGRGEWAGALDVENMRSPWGKICGLLIALSTAFSISRVLLPHQIDGGYLLTSGQIVPLIWSFTMAFCLVVWTVSKKPAY